MDAAELVTHGHATAFLLVLVGVASAIWRINRKASTTERTFRKLIEVVTLSGFFFRLDTVATDERHVETDDLKAYRDFACLCADVYEVDASRLVPRLCRSGFCSVLHDADDNFVLAYKKEENNCPSHMLIVVRGTSITNSLADILTNVDAEAYTPDLNDGEHSQVIQWWLQRWEKGDNSSTVAMVAAKFTNILRNDGVNPVQLHKGFWERAMKILAEVKSTAESRGELQLSDASLILLTGHSLGGAAAHCLALLLSVIRSVACRLCQFKEDVKSIVCLTYGQPKIYCTAEAPKLQGGNTLKRHKLWVEQKKRTMKAIKLAMQNESARYYHIRVVSVKDMVPVLPPPLAVDSFVNRNDLEAMEFVNSSGRRVRYMHEPWCVLIEFKFNAEADEDKEPKITTKSWTRSFNIDDHSALRALGLLVKYALDLPTHTIGLPTRARCRGLFRCSSTPIETKNVWYSYEQLLHTRWHNAKREREQPTGTSRWAWAWSDLIWLAVGPSALLLLALFSNFRLTLLIVFGSVTLGTVILWIALRWPQGEEITLDGQLKKLCMSAPSPGLHGPSGEVRLNVNQFNRSFVHFHH